MYLWIFLIVLFLQNVLFVPSMTGNIVLVLIYTVAQIPSIKRREIVYVFPLTLFFLLCLVVQNIWLQILCAFLLGFCQNRRHMGPNIPQSSPTSDYMNVYILGVASMFVLQNAPSFLSAELSIFMVFGTLFLSFFKRDMTSSIASIVFVVACYVGISFFPKWTLLLVMGTVFISCNSITSQLVFLSALLWFQFASQLSGILQLLMFLLPFSIVFFRTIQKQAKPFYVFFQSVALILFLLGSPTTSKMSFLVNSEKNMEIQFEKTRSEIISTSSFDTLERQAGLLIHRFLPPQSQIAIRGDWFFNISSVFVDKHVVYYDVPDPQITSSVVKNSDQGKRILSHINFQVLHSLDQFPSHRYHLFFDVLHSDHILGNYFVSNPAQKYWMKKFQLTDNGLYVALIHLSQIKNISCLLSDLQQTFDHHQVWFLPNSFDAVLFVGSMRSFEDFYYPSSQKNTITSKQRISIFKQLAFTKTISVKQCPLFVSETDTIVSYPILDLNLYIDQFPNIDYLPEQERHAIQLQREDMLTNLRAFEASKQGNLQKAFSIASKSKNNAILINPHIKNAKIAIQRAKKEGMSSPEWNEALRHAQTAHMLSPSTDLPKVLLAEIAIGQGYTDKAKEWFRQVLDSDGENLKAIDGMARIAGLENRPEEVESWLKKAFSIKPDDPITSHNLGYFYLQQRELEQADSYLRTSLQKNPESIETQLAISELYLFREEYARARITIDRIHQTKKAGMSWFLRGRAHFGLMEYESAEEDFRRAILADPKMDNARGAIGNCKIAQGDLEGAAQAYRSALYFNPNNKAAKDNLIKVEQELSRLSTEK